MKTISVAWLREKHACEDQVARVEAEWGIGEIELSRANLERAVQLMLDLGWLAGATLDGPAWDACNAATKPAWDACNAAIKAAWDAYDEATKPTRDAYDEAIKPAWDACNAATKPAWDAYDAACVTALADALGER